MTPRKLVLMLMAWSPAVFMGGLAVHSRTSVDAFEFASGEAWHDRVVAYGPVLKEANLLRSRKEDGELAERIAQDWVRQYQSGTLTVLEPAFFEDTMKEGSKAQISEAASRVVGTLIDSARDRQSEISVERRVQRVLLAMSLCEAMKYSDFPTVYETSREQIRALHVLDKLAPMLDEPARAAVVAQLEAYRPDQSKMAGLTQVMRRLYADSVRRKGKEPISIEEAQRNVALTEEMRNGDGPSLKVISRRLYAMNDEAPKFLTDLKLAWSAVRSQDEALAKSLTELGVAAQ